MILFSITFEVTTNTVEVNWIDELTLESLKRVNYSVVQKDKLLADVPTVADFINIQNWN